jgi:Family of unknown function (DUF5670)
LEDNVAGLLWGVVVVLFVLWLLGAFVVHLGAFIHFLLVLAVIAIVFNLITSSRSRAV